jgi:hypothetical protein
MMSHYCCRLVKSGIAMKTLFSIIFVLLYIGSAIAADAPMDIGLMDGSKIKGRVVSTTASEVTVMSDLGVFRIPLEKLTLESRKAITSGSKPDVDTLLQRIAELEGKVSHLQQENESLRRQAVASPTPAHRTSEGSSFSPPGSPTKATVGGSYSLSSTGKRHNSGCRYFGSGRSCGPTDGIACKICGG